MASRSPQPHDPQAALKQEAAKFAVDLVQSGMAVGLGSGSTAIFAIRRVAELLAQGELHHIVGCPTSNYVRREAEALGIPLMDDGLPEALDITIDGADEVDPDHNLIKGGGGALLREKIVAQASRKLVIVVDETKMSPQLGTHHVLPLEVLAFGLQAQLRFLRGLGAQATVRSHSGGAPFATDSGNLILDCDFGPIASPAELASQLSSRAGIIEHGLFLGLTTDLIVAGVSGVRRLTNRPK